MCRVCKSQLCAKPECQAGVLCQQVPASYQVALKIRFSNETAAFLHSSSKWHTLSRDTLIKMRPAPLASGSNKGSAALGCARQQTVPLHGPAQRPRRSRSPRPVCAAADSNAVGSTEAAAASSGAAQREQERLRGTHRRVPAGSEPHSQVIPLTALHSCDPPSWASRSARTALYNNTPVERVRLKCNTFERLSCSQKCSAAPHRAMCCTILRCAALLKNTSSRMPGTSTQ